MRLRLLTLTVIVLSVLWGGYWFVGRSALEHATAAAFTAARADGRVASYSALNVEGFPNRFDMTLHDLALGDPAQGMVWRAPKLRLFALSYRPNRMIAVLPQSESIELGDQVVTVSAPRIEANFNLQANTALTFDGTALVADALALVSSAGWRLNFGQLRAAAQAVPEGTNRYRFGLDALTIAPGPVLRAAMDPGHKLPAAIDVVHLDGHVAFDAALDRHAGQTQPHVTEVSLKNSHADWGPLKITAEGKVTVDATGQPEGRITLTVTDWQTAVDVAQALGAVPPNLAPTLRRALEGLATGQADPDTVALPLVFHQGLMSFGPLPLGPAPRFR